jgi:alpha-1,6-mannosyltransferase
MTEARPVRWHEARAWQTNAALLLIGAGMFALAKQFVSEDDHFTIGFSGVSGWSVTLYIAAIVILFVGRVDRFTFPIILGVGIVCRLVTINAEPFLSSDVLRYVWDGIVQHAHISPYRYVPGDPTLSFLRQPNIDIFMGINRRDYARTIYPPAAQVLFYLITWISPTMIFMKTAMVLFEGLTMWGLIQLLRELGIRREQTLLYAWCPLLIWEIGGSGHLDSAAMAFITLALLFRYRNRPLLTGLFLGLAVMTKLYPILLLPALYRRGDWKMPATVAALIAGGYAAYSSVGMLVFGFLGGYAKEEGLETGVRYFLLDWAQHQPGLHNLPIAAFYALCIVVFGSLIHWSWRTASQPGSAPDAFLKPAFGLALALMLLFSPHYPWYIAWLIPFFCLMPNLPALVYIGGFFYGYTTALADPGPKMFLLNEYLYAAVLSAVAVTLLLTLTFPRLPADLLRPFRATTGFLRAGESS